MSAEQPASVPHEGPIRIPFLINVRERSNREVSALLEVMAGALGGAYFRDKGLLMAVIADQRAAAKAPLSYLAGPYIGMIPRGEGCHRIISSTAVPGGYTVYAPEQLLALVARDHGRGRRAPGGGESSEPGLS
ncbi:hypothetical protein J2T57_001420 [Natronocella acetinitrilica]|uniref:Uncharacterized protein n=1 Tax=Natronocella acetinitrilica TaxID=414046 RepID=A0AAE3G359_9GAMM|nr:hypothetical protein [Natronocella acetinitrilica]MCP1674318.1 hypothetical protein [Natronocella acetinitrilica]